MTEKQLEGLEENGFHSVLRLKTVNTEIAPVFPMNAPLRDDRDAAKKQPDECIISKLLKDVAHLQNEPSAAKLQGTEETFGLQNRSRFTDEVHDLGQHLPKTRVPDAAVPHEGSNIQVEHLTLS